MKKELINRYDTLMCKMRDQRSHISRVIKSCRNKSQLDNTLAWALGLWSMDKRIIQRTYDDIALYHRPAWLDLKMQLEYWCNTILWNDVVQEVEKQREIINTPQS